MLHFGALRGLREARILAASPEHCHSRCAPSRDRQDAICAQPHRPAPLRQRPHGPLQCPVREARGAARFCCAWKTPMSRAVGRSTSARCRTICTGWVSTGRKGRVRAAMPDPTGNRSAPTSTRPILDELAGEESRLSVLLHAARAGGLAQGAGRGRSATALQRQMRASQTGRGRCQEGAGTVLRAALSHAEGDGDRVRRSRPRTAEVSVR